MTWLVTHWSAIVLVGVLCITTITIVASHEGTE